MKNPKLFIGIIFIFILIFFINNKSFSQTGWALKSTGSNINSVFFTDVSHGWMVGDSGLVYASYDGGINWFGLESKIISNLNSVFFKDASTGWAAGNNGAIIKTTDGGDNWVVLSTGVTWDIKSIHFPTYDTGYALGFNNLYTTNGGSTWSELGITGTANAVFFTSAETGFYVNDAHIYKTTNSGLAWTTFIFTGHKAIFFINSSTGWAPGSSTRYTSNGGTNWSSQTTGSGFSTLYGIHFSDASSGWSVGSIETISGNSSIRRTTNAGTNWTGQSSGTTNILRSVSAISGLMGVTVGDAGTVLLTTNGGTNWDSKLNVFSFPTTSYYNLYSTFFINENTGWSGSYSGIVNKTTNGGDNWSTVTTSSFNSINSIHFLDIDTGWVCGDGGMIQNTNNGGSNWSSQFSGTSNRLNDINVHKLPLTGFFGLYKIGWCVGKSGTILYTIDGGSNWVSQMSHTSADLYSVVAFSEHVAIACGDSGKILKTTDGGTNWFTTVSGAVGGALRSISFADDNNGICVGDSATVLYTTNKGDTWSLDITGPRGLSNKNLYDVSARMDLMLTYTAIGEEGIILKSEDEGGSWTKQSSGVKTRLYGISSPAENVSYIVGTKGTIIKTDDGGALPVELVSFNYSLNKNNVILNWATSVEINNSGFDVERMALHSAKNPGQWIKINFVEGHGNTNSQLNYSYEDKYLSPGKYNYRIKQIDFNGNYEYYYLFSEVNVGVPDNINLYQNYPNPFNPSTIISFDLPAANFISLKVYNSLGKEVKTLMNEKKDAGHYSVEFEGSNFSTGIYFYTITAGNLRQTKKMLLLK